MPITELCIQGTNMDNEENINNLPEEDRLKLEKLQNDAVRLMRTLDLCMDNVDGLYAYILRKNFLGCQKTINLFGKNEKSQNVGRSY